MCEFNNCAICLAESDYEDEIKYPEDDEDMEFIDEELQELEIKKIVEDTKLAEQSFA